MQLSANDIRIVKDYFKEKPVLKAYLFGSYSRNDATHDSDVDIWVDLDYTRHIGLGFVTMQRDLQDRLHKNVDLVYSKAISNHLQPFIEMDKILIYER